MAFVIMPLLFYPQDSITDKDVRLIEKKAMVIAYCFGGCLLISAGVAQLKLDGSHKYKLIDESPVYENGDTSILLPSEISIITSDGTTESLSLEGAIVEESLDSDSPRIEILRVRKQWGIFKAGKDSVVIRKYM